MAGHILSKEQTLIFCIVRELFHKKEHFNDQIRLKFVPYTII